MMTRIFIAAVLTTALMPFPARSVERFFESIDLFQAGKGGYALYHIPGIVVTANGTVLAWCEARQKGGDWDQIEILLRRSNDDGKTWSDATKFPDVPGPKPKNPFALRVKGVKETDVTYNNPVLIAGRDGTVHGLFCLEYMRSFYIRSVDDGVTWSTPVEITPTFEKFRPAYDWKVLATGPDHGIQLKNGRLIVPVWLSTGTGGNAHRPSMTATVYSDDQGKTWNVGERRAQHPGVSYDEGKTWAVSKPVDPGWSQYSDLAVTQSGTILYFHGHGERAGFAGDRLRLDRFNLEWLTDGKDSLPTRIDRGR